MRLARLLVDDEAQPVLALERDGALYDVAELDRVFDTRFSPDRMGGASDFHVRAVALGGAGLGELDERLRAGDRPTTARILPGTFAWLAPCDTERARYLQLAPHELISDEPLHRIGDARSLLGHASAVPFPGGAGAVAELALAVVLREPLRCATVAEAEGAILGVTILNAWTRGDDGVTAHGWVSKQVPAQLGPVLVTTEETGLFARLRAQIRVGGDAVRAMEIGAGRFSLAESIAWTSESTELCPGDVVGGGTVRSGRLEVAFGTTIELAVERLGKLEGRPLGR